MSGGKSSGKTQSQQQSQSFLDPAIVSALEGNVAATQGFASGAKYSPLTGAQSQSYLSPYMGSAVNATATALDNQRRQQLAQNGLAAAASGAYDGTGRAVLDGLTNQFADQTLASTVSSMENTGYQAASQTAQGENSAANQYPIVLRHLINESLGLAGNPVLSSSSGSSSGSNSSFNFGFAGSTSPGGFSFGGG